MVASPVRALNQTFYIDCSLPTDGDGSLGTPWNTPESLFDHQRPPTSYTFGGGDQVLVRRGTTCNWPLHIIRGAGTPISPVLVSTYGNPADPRPIINGSGVETDNWDGQPDSSAVHVYDADNLIIEDLELTNTGGNPLDGRRQGIQIFAVERYGAHANITIRDNYIHDIEGEYKKNHEATAGILLEQRLPPVGLDPTPDPTWFENVTIEDNLIENTNRQGIAMWGDWRNRPEDGYDPTGPAWTGWTGVIIRDNTIRHVRGDAILVSNTDGAMVSGNVVEGFNELNALDEATIQSILSDAQTKQGLPTPPSRRHAGIWTYNADNTTIEHNDVRGGVSNQDGMAYDIDGGSVGTVIQYNYSQDNEGGFALICTELGQIRDGIIRYNISKDDGFSSITGCVGEVLNTQVYNNTIHSTAGVQYPWRQVDWIRFGGDTMTDVRDIEIVNNIFSYPGQDIPYFFYNEREGEGIVAGQVDVNTTADNNLFYGVVGPPQDSSALGGHPRFYDTSLADDGFVLRSNSPAYQTGATVVGNGGLDYFGSVLSLPFNVGADETEPPQRAMWFVTPPTDRPITIIRTDDGADASDGLEQPTGSGQEVLTVMIEVGGVQYRIADFTVALTADRDLSDVSFDYDPQTGGVIVHGLSSAPGVVGGQFDLLLPLKAGELPAAVCPGASVLADLSTDCNGYYELNLGDDGFSQETIGGREYYRISGLSGTGAFYPSLLGLAGTGMGAAGQTALGLGLMALAFIAARFSRQVYRHPSFKR